MINNDAFEYSLEHQAELFIANYPSNNITHNVRKAALAHFKQQGVPNLHNEDWKYTDLKHLIKSKFVIKPYNDHKVNYNSILIELIRTNINHLYDDNNKDLSCIVMLDGNFRQDLSSINSSVLNNKDCFIVATKEYFNNKLDSDSINSDYYAMAEFVNATWHDGVIIKLNNKILNKIIILNIYTEHSDNVMVNSKNICFLSACTELELFELYMSASNIEPSISGFFHNNKKNNINFSSNILFDIHLSNNSKCTHYLLNNNSDNNYNIANYYVQQGQDSQYNNYNFNFGGKLSRQDIIIKQDQDNCSVKLHGLFMPRDVQHMDAHLKVFHNASYGHSNQDYSGVLFDRANGVFSSMVYVANKTKNNNSTQKNKNLLLSKDAQINTKPELQIYSCDVFSAHGATIGNLDENALFYLRSRGVNITEAKKMLIEAFINKTISNITDANTIKWLRSALIERLKSIK